LKIDDWLLDILACPNYHAPQGVDEARQSRASS